MKRVLLGLLFLGLVASPAFSQSLVVQTCGMLPLAYSPGATRQDTVDINGQKCTTGGGSAGTTDVNLIQILGAAPSLTNPLWVFPATGATFPVSGTVTANQGGAPWSTTISGTPTISGTVTANQGGAPWSTTISGTVAATQSGSWTVAATQSGTWTVTGAGGTFPATQSGTWTVQPGNTANTVPWLTKTNDGTNSILLDPCQTVAKTNVPISQAANAQIVTGTSSVKTYICSMFVIVADDENVSLVEGTGSVCGTNTAAIIGGTTAANGPNLAANGGWTLGNGAATVASSAVNANNVCLFQSGTGRIAGNLTYVQR